MCLNQDNLIYYLSTFPVVLMKKPEGGLSTLEIAFFHYVKFSLLDPCNNSLHYLKDFHGGIRNIFQSKAYKFNFQRFHISRYLKALASQLLEFSTLKVRGSQFLF